MFAINFIIASNPFYNAYYYSDFLGKLIFLSIIFTSIVCWVILCHKFWETSVSRKKSRKFYEYFQKNSQNPLNVDWPSEMLNPFLDLYHVLKRQTVDVLNKNHRFSGEGRKTAYLSPSDIEFVEAHLLNAVSGQIKKLESNLFILATIVGLAPLLGLLGTVWGILMTFSSMQTHSAAGTNQMMLHGLSLALTTTVLGLLTAIPALIAYNWLKNGIRSFETEMEGFSTEILSLVEMQYRKVDF